MKIMKSCLRNLRLAVGVVVLLAVAGPSLLCAADSHTHTSGVKIVWKASPKIFPKNWRSKKINAKATQLGKKEARRSLAIVKAALNKYPVSVLKKNLKTVYLVGKLSYSGVKAGGTNSRTAVYLANLGVRRGYSKSFIEKVFHSELSSILLRNHKKLFSKANWTKINPRGFKYGRSGVAAIKKGAASKKRQPKVLKAGFLYSYAASSMENDVNALAAQLFMNRKSFWRDTKKYPKIGHKAREFIKFYHKINPEFNWKYFHSL